MSDAGRPMRVKPPVPEDVRRPQGPGPADVIRRRLVAWAHQAADGGMPGLRSSRAVVICGFPRSGSTLLQLMLEAAYPHAKQFGRERAALNLARHVWPGRHTLLISKRPNDVFWVDEIRNAYRGRSRGPCFIVTTRDPRAVLTSKHGDSSEYYVSVERWRAMFDHIRYVRQADDVLTIDYAELVQNPKAIQQRLVAAIGEVPAGAFDEFSSRVPSGFRTTALNGLRPIDTASLHKWRQPQNAERIRAILAAVPELPGLLIETGYESDENWTAAYR